MAKNTDEARGSNRHWTNERHLNFLNSMEASFVQSMLQNNNRVPPLDRYLPDTSDSTEDSGWNTRRRPFVSDNVESSGGRSHEKKTRILSCQKSSQDQVVPQFEQRRGDKDKDG